MKTWHLACATALAGVLLFSGYGSAMAQSGPAGSYSRTCKDCKVSGGSITCSCQKINGSFSSATIDWSKCSGGSLTNLDGVLVCGP